MSSLKLLLSLAFGFFFFLLLEQTVLLQEAAREAFFFSIHTLLPSLFPFAVLSHFFSACPLPIHKCLAERLSRLLGLSTKALSGATLGILGGFPIGAVSAEALLQTNAIEKEEAERLGALFNNASLPFLLIGVSSRFGGREYGILLLSLQTLATLCVAFLTRKAHHATPPPYTQPVPFTSHLALFATAIKSAALAMLSLSAFVVFFAVVIKALTLIPLIAPIAPYLALLLEPAAALFAAKTLSEILPLPLALSLCAFALGFSGVSTLMQTAAIFGGKLSLSRLFKIRLAIGTLSFFLTLVSASVFFS